MWSRRFLWTGLSSGAFVAALTVAALWLALFVAFISDSKNPFWTWANIAEFAVPGLIIYPVCWFIVVFRHRDYSLYRTLVLVVTTFGVTGAFVVAVMMLGSIYGVIAIFLQAPKVLLTAKGLNMLFILAWTPVAYLLATAIGAIILIVPYIVVAMPMALFHRWLLLRVFGSAGPRTPNLTPSVPIIPSHS
jgi:uncharacterized membrane protein YhdT